MALPGSHRSRHLKLVRNELAEGKSVCVFWLGKAVSDFGKVASAAVISQNAKRA